MKTTVHREGRFRIIAVMVAVLFMALLAIPSRVLADSLDEISLMEAGEKAITLFKDGEIVGNFENLADTIKKMDNLTTNGKYQFNFVIQVNQDIELNKLVQFSVPHGPVTIRSKDPQNPCTIKANNIPTSDVCMLSIVNGAKVSVENITIDGNKQKRLFWLQSTESLPAELIIENGAVLQNGMVRIEDVPNAEDAKGGGAIWSQEASSVTINGGIIRNNEAATTGGAIAYLGTKTLTINGGEISNNNAPSLGGGIFLQGKGQITGGSIHDNTAVAGAGIATGDNANLEITGGKIGKNEASNAGGGIYLFSNSLVKLSGGEVSGNQAERGGGVTVTSAANFIMEGGLISANEASKRGGGVYVWKPDSACELKSGTIEKNQSPFGGGIRVDSAKATIGAVLIQENIANYGGGIYSSIPKGESITVEGAKLIKNEAQAGGGYCLVQGGSLNFNKASFEGNKAYYGGGIWTNTQMDIKGCTFNANEAQKSEEAGENNGHGGAIYVNEELAKGEAINIRKSTFTNNIADKTGGAISINTANGLVKVENGTSFTGNEASGEWGQGGAIYSNLYAYPPVPDHIPGDSPIPSPTPDQHYTNINTDESTVFNNNKAFRTFTPPSTKDQFHSLLYQSTSHPGTKYDHPLNNDDINLISSCHVVFDKNYVTDEPIHASFDVLGKSTLGSKFPADPVREGYTFKGWNTKKDGTGTAFTDDTVVEEDITVYAIYTCKVIFDKNYETENPIHASFDVVEKSTLGGKFPGAPVREGYTFKSWNTKQDGTGTAFTADTVIDSNITVYAIYEKGKACKVIFDKNYETENPIHASFEVPEKSTLGSNFPGAPVREGYTFKSWNTKQDGTGTAFTADTVIESDITVYAIYEHTSESSTPQNTESTPSLPHQRPEEPAEPFKPAANGQVQITSSPVQVVQSEKKATALPRTGARSDSAFASALLLAGAFLAIAGGKKR